MQGLQHSLPVCGQVHLQAPRCVRGAPERLPALLTGFRTKCQPPQTHPTHGGRQRQCRHMAPPTQAVAMFKRAAAAESKPAVAAEHYLFPSTSGSQVSVSVEQQANAYVATVSVPSALVPGGIKPQLQWGSYRVSPAKWFQPEAVVPKGSQPDKASGAMRSEMTQSTDKGSFQIQLSFPASLAPLTLAFLVHLPGLGDQGKGSLLGPRLGAHFSVPVGMLPGRPDPLGATAVSAAEAGPGASVNFAVRSRDATAMSLCLARTQQREGKGGFMEVALDPVINRTGDAWHIQLGGLKDLQSLAYGWRADSSHAVQFYPGQLMLDPYAPLVASVQLPEGVQVIPPNLLKQNAKLDRNAAQLGSLAALTAAPFDWGAAPVPNHPAEELLVLEVDIATFTRCPAATKVAPERQGKLLGLLDRVEHLKAVGANAVMLTPLVVTGPGLGQMGRAPVSFFAPDPQYAVGAAPDAPAAELKQLVRGLHAQGIEVILQVEYCFTAEGSEARPNPLSLQGLDADIYYRGHGVLNCGHAVVRQLVLDSLLHWADEYQLDGFCFLNAETLVQDREGVVMDAPALVEEMAAEAALRQLKLVAWAADDALLPRGGERGFPHWGAWLERNKRFAADFTTFLAGSGAGVSGIATRVTGSADLFAARWDGGLPGSLATGRRPAFGLNSVAFLGRSSLQQLATAAVPPDAQWQERGEGMATRRESLCKALLLAVLLAQGVPTISQEDVQELGMARFVGVGAALRRRHHALLQLPSFTAPRDIRWHGAASGSQPDWEGSAAAEGVPGAGFMGYSLRTATGQGVYVGFNSAAHHQQVDLPEPPAGARWHLAVDTGKAAPQDAVLEGAPAVAGTYVLQAKSAIMLEAQPDPAALKMRVSPAAPRVVAPAA